MLRIKQLILTFFLLGLNLALLAQSGTIISSIQLVDGTGKPAVNASVRIVGNKIVAIGNFKPNKTDQIIDGQGKVLAPGFIDSHSHHFGDLNKNRAG